MDLQPKLFFPGSWRSAGSAALWSAPDSMGRKIKNQAILSEWWFHAACFSIKLCDWLQGCNKGKRCTNATGSDSLYGCAVIPPQVGSWCNLTGRQLTLSLNSQQNDSRSSAWKTKAATAEWNVGLSACRAGRHQLWGASDCAVNVWWG